jgi:hypothetical protein
MVIDMNEAQVRTLEQVRQVLAGTQVMEFQAAAADAQRYAWIENVLKRFDYPRLARADRGAVLAYLQRLSGYSRAQGQPARVDRPFARTPAAISFRLVVRPLRRVAAGPVSRPDPARS